VQPEFVVKTDQWAGMVLQRSHNADSEGPCLDRKVQASAEEQDFQVWIKPV
jgi:hypothetical protein